MTLQDNLQIISKHLDIGCGLNARNPLGAKELWGCDLIETSPAQSNSNFRFIKADLSHPPLPFLDGFFSSVSAFDVIEHIPRTGKLDGQIYSPFIELMNEIHRILCHHGLFMASTPVYPHPAVFQDPTHVNFITDQTHNYFCGSEPYARRYGFNGQFAIKRVVKEPLKNLLDHESSELKKNLRIFKKKYFQGGLSHITWELIAVK